MSHLIVPDASELVLQELWVSYAFGSVVQLGLYKNNYTPIASSLGTDFTLCDYTGYSNQNITTYSSLSTVSGRARFVFPTKTFTMGTPGSGNTIYGYVFGISAGGGPLDTLLWAERFDSPIVFANAGDNIVLTPQFDLFSEF